MILVWVLCLGLCCFGFFMGTLTYFFLLAVRYHHKTPCISSIGTWSVCYQISQLLFSEREFSFPDGGTVFHHWQYWLWLELSSLHPCRIQSRVTSAIRIRGQYVPSPSSQDEIFVWKRLWQISLLKGWITMWKKKQLSILQRHLMFLVKNSSSQTRKLDLSYFMYFWILYYFMIQYSWPQQKAQYCYKVQVEECFVIFLCLGFWATFIFFGEH